MRKIILAAALLTGCLSFQIAAAQVRFSVGVNIGAQPDWGPVGYDHVDYYYIPDADAYYDVSVHQYVYYRNHAWVHARYLPGRYRNYDIYHGYKVVVNQHDPWMHHATIRARYAGYRGRHDQVIIRDSHDARYRNHWHDDYGRHRGWDKGRDHEHDDHHRDHGHDDHHRDHGHDDHHH